MYQYQHPHPAVTTDIVLFSIGQQQLKCLLIRRRHEPYQDSWALPGGFVGIEEDLEAAARRELREETGITGVTLEQLHSFGKPGRDPRERVISVAYYALVPDTSLPIWAASDAAEVAWFGLDDTPPLAFDHESIVAMARQRLVAGLHTSTIALQFMPEKFTLTELQMVYEIIQGGPIDTRHFRKNILATRCLMDCGKTSRNDRRRPARLYSCAAMDAVAANK